MNLISLMSVNTNLQLWLNENLFTFNWWILFLTTIGFIMVWLIILDKKRKLEIISYGLMVAITATTLDMLGISLLLWHYPYTLIPIPIQIGVDIIQLPIIYMIVYQYFDTWKTFLVAMAIKAFIFVLILEQLLKWLGIYELYGWKDIYSFVIYIIIGAVFKYVINKLKQTDVQRINS